MQRATRCPRVQLFSWTFHGSRYCLMTWTQNQENRIQEAHEKLHNRFENIVWPDESMIQLEKQCTFSYKKAGEVPILKARSKLPFEVMVRAGISRKGETRICLLNCAVNSSVYREVLWTHLLPFLQECLPDGWLQQGNTLCHEYKATRKFLACRQPSSPAPDRTRKPWLQSHWKFVALIETFYVDNGEAPWQGQADRCKGFRHSEERLGKIIA